MQRKKYGMIRVISSWLDLLPQILDQWRVFISYGLIFMFLSAIFGRWTYACHGKIGGFWCRFPIENIGINSVAIIIYYLLSFYLFVSFAADFYKGLSQSSPFSVKHIFALSVQKMKSIFIMLLFLLLLILPASVFVYIVNKPANSDWRIEFVYFTVAFIMLVVPFLVMRCSGAFAYWFNYGSACIKTVWRQTSGRAYVGILGFLLLMLICSDFNMTMIRYFSRLQANYNYLWVALLIEFSDVVLKLFYISLFLTFFQAQYLQIEQSSDSQSGKNGEE